MKIGEGSNNDLPNQLKNFLEETNNNDDDNITREELKSVQKSIALFKQDIRKILREELFRFLLRLNNNEGQQQAIGNRYKQ